MPDPTDFEEFPVFGDNSSKEKPGDQKYAAGFQPGDVLPAEWLNWFLNTISKGYNQLVYNAANLINLVYPVGSIYMSVNSVSPATFLGGTWERIQDTFLLAAGTTYAAGATGGKAEFQISTTELPEHNHELKGIEVSTDKTPCKLVVQDDGNLVLVDSSGTAIWNAGRQSTATKSYSVVTLGSGSTNTQNKGSGAMHNNMPPYLAVYVWKRTA